MALRLEFRIETTGSSPSHTARFQTVERQLREGDQQRTSKLSAIGLTRFGELGFQVESTGS